MVGAWMVYLYLLMRPKQLSWRGQYCRGHTADVCLPTDEDDANRLGEKVILREQVKELFNEKYGQCSLVLPCGRGGSTGWLL